jgi:hypothetical protein
VDAACNEVRTNAVFVRCIIAEWDDANGLSEVEDKHAPRPQRALPHAFQHARTSRATSLAYFREIEHATIRPMVLWHRDNPHEAAVRVCAVNRRNDGRGPIEIARPRDDEEAASRMASNEILPRHDVRVVLGLEHEHVFVRLQAQVSRNVAEGAACAAGEGHVNTANAEERGVH